MTLYKDFAQLNLRIGKIKAVKPHPKTDDYILLVDIGPIGADKQVVVNLKNSYSLAELMGKSVIIAIAEEPVIVKGIESLGLVLISHRGKKPVLLEPKQKIPPGVRVCGLSEKEVTFKD